jgi:hypothetical protein
MLHELIARGMDLGEKGTKKGTEDLVVIRLHIHQDRALGGRRFQAIVTRKLNRPVAVRPRRRSRATVLKDSNG